MEKEMNDTGLEMRRKRYELELSARQLGEKIGCSGDHILNMELGNKRFLPHWIEKINDVYTQIKG